MFALMKCSFTPYQHLGQSPLPSLRLLLLLYVASPLHRRRLFTAVFPIHLAQYIPNPTPPHTEGRGLSGRAG